MVQCLGPARKVCSPLGCGNTCAPPPSPASSQIPLSVAPAQAPTPFPHTHSFPTLIGVPLIGSCGLGSLPPPLAWTVLGFLVPV